MKPITTLLLLSSLAATAWDLPRSIKALDKPYECPVEIQKGPFEFQAKLSLGRLDGSAASVMFGDAMNFGFDSRSGSLFAEGGSLGKTTMLEKSSEFIEAGKPFVFDATRSERGVLRLSIDGTEVFETDKLAKWTGAITLRPHRNVMTVESLSLAGSIEEPEPGLLLRRTVIPILIDDELHPVLELDLVIEEPRTLEQVDLELGNSEFLSALAIAHEGKIVMAATPGSRSSMLKGRLPLPAGRHRLQVHASIEPGTDPLASLTVTCRGLAFADRGFMKPHPVELPALRLAYPIHKQGEFDCHTFRIPAIARATDGSLLAVYDMRYNSRRDLQEHMDIGLSRSTDGGITWADPVPIMDMGEWGGKPQKENGCSDPGILVDEETGEVFVTAMWTHGKPGTHQWTGNGSEPGHDIHRSSQFMLIRSKDHGVTWSPPENLTESLKDPAWYLFAPAPGNGITMKDGTLVMPTQGRDAEGRPFSNITWSKDRGATWTVSAHARDNTTECAVAELSDGSLLLNMRDNRNHRDKSDTNGRAMGVTKDLGKTWTVHSADHGALPEPTCMASMISHILEDGRHVLIFSNPRNRHARKDMTIQLSFDDGVTWPEAHHLVLDEKGGAYSSLVMIDDQTLGILYESSQADLVFQRISLSELLR